MLKLNLQYFGHLIRRADSLEKTKAGKIEGKRRLGMTEDERVGWHHQLNGHNFEQTQEIMRVRKPGVLQSMGPQRVGRD